MTEQQTTRVVNIRKEAYDVYIGWEGKGQGGYFGNPIRLNPGEARGSTLEKFKDEDELMLYDKFAEMILSLDSLNRISKSKFDEDKEIANTIKIKEVTKYDEQRSLLQYQ